MQSFKILFLLLFIYGFADVQQPQKPNLVEIYNQIQKLMGYVLYIAGHPDEENTKKIRG